MIKLFVHQLSIMQLKLNELLLRKKVKQKNPDFRVGSQTDHKATNRHTHTKKVCLSSTSELWFFNTHTQYQDPGTSSPKWNAVISHTSLCTFLTQGDDRNMSPPRALSARPVGEHLDLVLNCVCTRHYCYTALLCTTNVVLHLLCMSQSSLMTQRATKSETHILLLLRVWSLLCEPRTTIWCIHSRDRNANALIDFYLSVWFFINSLVNSPSV